MKVNNYTKTLLKKSDSELENMISNKNQFVDDAIFAANSILSDRNNRPIEQQEIESETESKKTSKEELAKETESFLTDDPYAPELYTKTTITVFSALFGVIFGAALMMYNIKQTNNSKGRIQVLIFGILYSIAAIAILNLLNTKSYLTIITNLFGAAIMTGVFWTKFIGKEFEHREKSWLMAAVISLAITIPLLLLIIYS